MVHSADQGNRVTPLPVAWFNGGFVDIAQAQVPVTAPALHYGTAVFEGIRAYGDGGKAWLFRVQDHYERMLYHASLLKMEIKESANDLVLLTTELLWRNQALGDSYIRPLFYSRSTRFGAGLWPEAGVTIYAIAAARAPALRPAVRAMISRWHRFPAACCPAGAKIAGLYVNSAFARQDALEHGCDQPILLTTDGMVAEGYGANLFAVHGRKITTPPIAADILPGITRATLLDHLRSRDDCDVAEAPLTPAQLARADELFFCGTGMEITPIGSLDDAAIGSGSPGLVTEAVAQWYRDTVTGRNDAPPHWRTPVHRGA